jgi:hypothetical protein
MAGFVAEERLSIEREIYEVAVASEHPVDRIVQSLVIVPWRRAPERAQVIDDSRTADTPIRVS